MSTDHPPPAGGGSARYFCHQCNRTVLISPPPISGELSCPVCHGGFIEEFDPPQPPQTPPPSIFSLNPSAAPFFPSSSPSPVFLSRSTSFDLRNPNDLFSLISFPSPSNPSADANAFNPFDFLQRYIQTLLSGGANIQIVLEGGDRVGGNLGDYFIGPGLEQLIQQLAENDPTRYGTPPAAKTAVDNLPDVGISKDQLESDEAQCAVCKDFFEMEEVVKKLPCNHLFHKDCIVPWLELHNSCPVCRFELPTDDADYEQRKGGGGQAEMSAAGTESGPSVGGSDEGSGNGQRVNPVERRFRISLPWPFRGSGNQVDAGGSGGGSDEASGGQGDSGQDASRRDLG